MKTVNGRVKFQWTLKLAEHDSDPICSKSDTIQIHRTVRNSCPGIRPDLQLIWIIEIQLNGKNKLNGYHNNHYFFIIDIIIINFRSIINNTIIITTTILFIVIIISLFHCPSHTCYQRMFVEGLRHRIRRTWLRWPRPKRRCCRWYRDLVRG